MKRLKEVIKMAYQLDWIFPPVPLKDKNGNDFSMSEYPLMILSEVEKCMLAMVDDNEFERMKRYVKQKSFIPLDNLNSILKL